MSGTYVDLNPVPSECRVPPVCPELGAGKEIAQSSSSPITKRRLEWPFVLILSTILLLAGGTLYATVSPDIPLESPVYVYLQRLVDRQLLPNHISSMKPISESYLSALVHQAKENLDSDASKDRDIRYLSRYLAEKAFSDPQNLIDGRAEVRGGIWGTNAESVPILDAAAEVNPLLENNGGRWKRGGIIGWMEPRLTASYGDWSAIEIQGHLPLQWSHQQGGGTFHPDLYSAYLKLGHGNFELQAGRFPVRWGNAKSGSLLFGENQKPFDQIQVSNSAPITLPWLFRYLGPIQFDAMVARLSDNQFFPNSYLVANRMVLKPIRILEVGYAQAVILGGEGSPDLSATDAILETLGRRRGDIVQINRSNRNFLFDFELKIPPAKDLTLYGEIYFEDCCGGNWLRDISNLGGVRIPSLLGHDLALYFEWVRTTEITYRNSVFQSGFADRNHLLGHPIGPDAMAFYLGGSYKVNNALYLDGRFFQERRGRNQKNQGGGDIRDVIPGFQDTENRWGLIVSSLWTPVGDLPYWIRGSGGYEYVHDFGYQDGWSRNHLMGAIEIGWNFH